MTGAAATATAGATLRHGEVRVAGVRSPYIEAGPERDPAAAIFVHGNPGSSGDWEDLVAAVGQFGRAIALDMPGFGRADKGESFAYTIPGYARHLDGALGQLGVRRAHLVLHDFGGAWGIAWAAQHPAAFASVTFINTGVLLGYRWHFLARVWRTPILGELLQAITRRAVAPFVLNLGMRRRLPAAYLDRMFAHYDAGTRRAVLRLYRATDDPGASAAEFAATLRPLARPALVVWGKRDPYIGFEIAERQREVFPAVETIVLEDSGHWPFADDPDATRAAVIPFLRRQLGH